MMVMAGHASSSSLASLASVSFSVRARAASPSETKFIVPALDVSFPAPVEKDFLNLPKPRQWEMVARRGDLPSIAPEPLTHFAFRGLSSRMNAVLADIKEVQRDDPFAKFVIFSQFAESLRAIQRQFGVVSRQLQMEDRPGFETALVDLSSTGGVKATEEALTRFNSDPECNICLLTLGASAAGLTLTQAKVCYILEPTHNAAEEAQALNRVHRIGQQQSVRCVIFYARGTCEERILALRKEQDTLTTMLSNLNSVAEAAGGEGEGDIEEEEEEAVVTNRNRHRRRKNTQARQNVAQLAAGTFFSAGQMTILFGASEERREHKESAENESAVRVDQQNDQRRRQQQQQQQRPQQRPAPIPPLQQQRAPMAYRNYFRDSDFVPSNAIELSDTDNDSYHPRDRIHDDY